ncbi:phosphoribosyltransferase [Nonomuraea terrae]|uniref:Phosphoribosyltransferase n=1 Tax=Nonomuraea terrae TaxID=2530383 RepID=A0A4R4XM13_9ACTN|nr:phosphoribosyltransferase [Nonomuraea terrae]TDD32030.1 phosphoribosyltransferase [Nonomuraea terrae]
MSISLAVEEGDDNGLFRLVARKEAVRAGTSWLSPETLMAASLSRFYDAHEACLIQVAGGPFTMVTTIPSTRLDRPIEAFHIMPRVISMIGALRDHYKPVLLPNDRYAAVLAGRDSHPDAFQMMGMLNGSQALRGERVLLVDDLFVSGAHMQSAAYTLFKAGAEEVVALAILRLIVPSAWHENRRSIWQEASDQPFSFDRCCLCAAARRW